MNPLEELKVSQLKSALKELGADSRGSKSVLMIRLAELLNDRGVDIESFVAAQRESDAGTNKNLSTARDEPPDHKDGLTSGPGPLTRAGSQVSVKGSASQISGRSSASRVSVSSLRASESAKKAGLRARAAFLKEKQRIELEEMEEEMVMNQQEMEMKQRELEMKQRGMEMKMQLKMRKEELQLQTDIAECEAKERVLLEAETSVNPGMMTVASPAEQVSGAFEKLGNPAGRTSSGEQTVSGSERRPERLCAAADLACFVPGAGEERGFGQSIPAAASPEASKEPQLDVGQVVLSQLQRTCLPKPEIPVFRGKITEYKSFIRAFDSRISSKTDSDSERLFYLEQYCEGKPKEIIKGCLHMEEDVGYVEARRLLEKRYGDPESISCAFVDMLMDWPQLRPGDVDGLDRFSLTLTSCLNVMKSIPSGARETDHPRTMRKIVEKLPNYLQDSWRREADKIKEVEKRRVRFDDIVAYVDREVRIQTNHTFGKQRDERTKKQTQTVSATAVTEGVRPPIQCLFCRGNHFTDLCADLAKLQWQKRREFVRDNRLCHGCLRKGHRFSSCFRKLTCGKCKRMHPTAMHKDGSDAEVDQRSTHRTGGGESTSIKNGRLDVAASEVSAGMSGNSSAMMAILPVKVWNTDRSRSIVTYAFLDLGSSATFCTPEILKALDISGETTHITMTTATTENQWISSKLVKGLKISDIEGQNVIDMPPSYTLDRIPVNFNDIATSKDLTRWPHLQELVPCRVDAEIGILIGANCPRALTPLEVREGEEACPFALRTALGWVVYGPRARGQVSCSAASVNRIRVQEPTHDVQDLHRKFVALYNQDFEQDHSADDVGLSIEDQTWLKIVKSGIRRVHGHYEIPLPLKNETPLPNNKQQAEKRAEHLKRKMARDEKYLQDYKKFVNDLIEKNYAERVKHANVTGDRNWYIPHHGIYHPMKPEKIRVVYDCSATYHGISLNSRLLQGPNLTSSLLGVLLRFREKPIAVMADIEKMFYQVRVPVEDRSLLRFLWWPDGDTGKSLEEYQMNVHLFGAVSSPACANFALRQTAEEFGDKFGGDVKDSINRSFYVDDFVRTGSTPEEVLMVARGVRDCCALGGFRLTGFVSNSDDVMLALPETERAQRGKLELTSDKLTTPSQRALGVQWDVSKDTLSFRINVRRGASTRRGILSTVSAVYDPLGFGAPFVLPAKVLLQDLCRLKLGWDEQIPEPHLKRWNRWCEELKELKEFSVPRSVTPEGDVQSCQLHMFADASETGYGAVGYVRVVDSAGTIRTSLLMSKARVAPLKVSSIPRLELASATLAVQMSTQILSELDLPVDAVHFWTDSVSTLRYIQNQTSRFKTFVANRLSIIHDGSKPDQWRYIPSALNPADGLSRGQSAQTFLHSRWTRGPAFLAQPMAEWPDQTHVAQSADEEDLEHLEVKRNVLNTVAVAVERDCTMELLNSTSDWYQLKKRVAWLLRLKHVLRQRAVRRKLGVVEEDWSDCSSRLTVQELAEAEIAVVRFVQEIAFPDEVTHTPVKKSSPLYRLNPCLMDGTLRVGGRLSNADIPYSAKHQMILPKKGYITDLIIRDMHERKGHSGREHVLAALRAKYWIVDGNASVRRVLSRCVRCRRIQGPMVTQLMSDLPEERTKTDCGVFSRVGADFFGPFYVKAGRKQFKRFCVLFTCLATHAIHIEVCDSLDTSSFINALRRFQARRGEVKLIRSDNGTNFVGAERELREELGKLRENKVHDSLLKEGIDWQFTPPGASSQGGVWERQIRSIRKVLNAVLREQTMTDESLTTLLCEVEAVLNSKPLTTVSSDPSDLQPLTPNDLLLLRGGPSPDGIFSDRDSFARRRWRQVQYLADVFWRRWVKEYLPLLQIRQKWNKVERNLAVGDVVLVADMNMPRCRWPLGRVLDVFPDRKGFVRSAMVKTAASVFKRPISKLVLVLETE